MDKESNITDDAAKNLSQVPKTNDYTELLNNSDPTRNYNSGEPMQVMDDSIEETVVSALETSNKHTTTKYRKGTSVISDFMFQAKASMFSSGLNLCNANIGAGVLGLPYAVSDSGWLMGIILFVIFATMSTFAFQLLMSVGSCYCCNGHVSSYAIVCNDIAPRLQVFIDIFIALGFTLTCTAYLIIIGDYMPLVTRELGQFDVDSDSILISREFWIILFLIVFIIPTTALKKLDELRFSSMIAIACFIYVTIIIIAYELSDNLNIDSEYDDRKVSAFPTHAFDFFRAAPMYIFAYGGHPLAFILTNELENPTLRRINITLIYSFGFVTIVYAVVGLFGYFTFGNQTKSNILLNYPDDSIWIVIVRIGLSVAVAFSYPVLASSWKQSMASLVFRVDKKGKDATDLIWYKYYGLVALLIFLTLTISMLTDNLGIVSKLQGATAGTFLQIIAPGLIYYYYDKLQMPQMLSNPMHNLKWQGAIFLIIFGSVMIPFGTTLVFISE